MRLCTDIYSSQSTLRGRVGEGFNILPYTEMTKEGGALGHQQQQHQQVSSATSVKRRFLVVDDVTSNRKVLGLFFHYFPLQPLQQYGLAHRTDRYCVLFSFHGQFRLHLFIPLPLLIFANAI